MEESNCQNTHAFLLDKLKEKEINFLNLQQELSDREREIESTKEMVLERHHEALSWETKWKLAEEARKYQHEELSATGEIGLIKSEIHRMEVRYNQLKRAQDKLSQDMESCVGHRDHVYEKNCAKEKLPENKGRSRNNGQHRINEMKNKMKQARNEIISVERNIAEVTVQKEEMHSELKKLKDTIDNERLQDSLLQNEIEQTILLKQEVCALQTRSLLFSINSIFIFRTWRASFGCNKGQNDIEISSMLNKCPKYEATLLCKLIWNVNKKFEIIC